MTDPRTARASGTGPTALAEALGRWEAALDAATAEVVAQQVRAFLEDVAARGPAEAAKGRSPQASDAIMAFALYCLNELGVDGLRRTVRPASSSSRPGEPPPASPAAPRPAPEAPAPPARPRRSPERTRELIEKFWKERVGLLGEPGFADLLEVFVQANTAGRKQHAWTLQALLRVYFEMDWTAAGDLLQELAYKAGGLVCELILGAPGANHTALMQAGCELLNRNAQFAHQYQCLPLPAHSGYDVNTCEAPGGQRRPGQSVIPQSFYITRRQSGQVCRRARVQWA